MDQRPPTKRRKVVMEEEEDDEDDELAWSATQKREDAKAIDALKKCKLEEQEHVEQKSKPATKHRKKIVIEEDEEEDEEIQQAWQQRYEKRKETVPIL